MPISDFGVILATYPGDYHFAKGTCESIRQFMPGVPIAVLVDGNTRVDALVRAYGVRPIYRDDVRDPFLQRACFGIGHTKMVAFWESPFEHFLYLDADAVLWGDVRDNVDLDVHDLVTSTPHEPNPAAQVRAQYFDPERIGEHVEAFDWHDRMYFNAGVFFARRGCFDLGLYKRLYALQQQHPDLFIIGDQGIFNLMAVLQQDAGTLRWGHGKVQQLMGHSGLFDGFATPPWRDPVPRFRVENGRPVVASDDHVVLHWAAGKPSILTQPPGAELMTHFRREALWRMTPWLAPVADRVLAAEEQTWVARRALRKGPAHMSRVLSREVRRAARQLLGRRADPS